MPRKEASQTKINFDTKSWGDYPISGAFTLSAPEDSLELISDENNCYKLSFKGYDDNAQLEADILVDMGNCPRDLIEVYNPKGLRYSTKQSNPNCTNLIKWLLLVFIKSLQSS